MIVLSHKPMTSMKRFNLQLNTFKYLVGGPCSISHHHLSSFWQEGQDQLHRLCLYLVFHHIQCLHFRSGCGVQAVGQDDLSWLSQGRFWPRYALFLSLFFLLYDWSHFHCKIITEINTVTIIISIQYPICVDIIKVSHKIVNIVSLTNHIHLLFYTNAIQKNNIHNILQS